MKPVLKLFLLTIFFSLSLNVKAQIKVDVKRKTETQVNKRANQKADQGISKGLDAVEDGLKGDKKKEAPAAKEAAPKTAEAPKKQSEAAVVKAENKDISTPNSLEAYSKYDFIPGEKVIFFDDFSQDAIGDFPALWNTNGTAEVVTTNLYPGNWMKFVCNESIWTDALFTLPENYTIEFDIVPIKGKDNKMTGYIIRFMQANNARGWDSGTAPGKGGFQFKVEYTGRPGYSTWFFREDCRPAALSGYKNEPLYKQNENQKYHIAIWVQKSRIRLYQDQEKMIDLPKGLPVDCIKPDRLRFEYGAAMVSNIRFAVGAPDMRNKLITEGKLVSYGIYFDVNKDVVKPESYGTLKEIAAVLGENPDVKVKITGHTDSDGADPANLELSKKRGAAVKNELIKSFGIDASRLESDGLGETQPIATNDSPANKALNRRVEFLKL
jgi:OmpA-OmpF porin, OOP family